MNGYDRIKALAKTHRRRIPDLLVLARQNDPFFAGAPAATIAAEWFAGLWRRFDFQTGVHLRRVHYVLVSQAEPVIQLDGTPYSNTLECWSRLNEAGKQARYLQLVAPDAFVDRRNPAPHLYRFHETPPQPDYEFGELPYCELRGIDADLAWALADDLRVPSIYVSGYDYTYCDQPVHLEIWVEKSTMNDILLPLCERYRVNLVTAAGFQSITGTVNLLARIPPDKPARIFYISDFDPAGDFMPQSVARQIEYFGERYAPGADITLTPLALTREQVQRYRLPRIPVKESDVRKQNFEAAYGAGAAELDALEALYPGELAQLVKAAITPYLDTELADAMSDAAGEIQLNVNRAWRRDTEEERAALKAIAARATEIYARYEEKLQDLDADLRAELGPLAEELKSVRHAVQTKMDAFDPDLPPRPVSELELPDESGWLFDSKRDYFQQLAVYKARRQAEDGR